MEPSVPDGKGVIYLISGPKRYIGQTTLSLDRRWQSHTKSANTGGTSMLHRAIRDHGAKQFHIEVISDPVPAKELPALETRLIAEYETLHPNGYNMDAKGKSARPRGKATEYDGHLYPTQKSAAKEMAKNENISFHCAVARLFKLRTEGRIVTNKVKLSTEKAREIRELNGKYSQPELAKMFGVSSKAISLVIHNKTWRE